MLALLSWRKIFLLRSEWRVETQESLPGLGKLRCSNVIVLGEMCRSAGGVSLTYNRVASSGISQDVVWKYDQEVCSEQGMRVQLSAHPGIPCVKMDKPLNPDWAPA